MPPLPAPSFDPRRSARGRALVPAAAVAVAVAALVAAVMGNRGDETDTQVASRRDVPLESAIVKAPPLQPLDTSVMGGPPAPAGRESLSPGSPAR